MPHLYYFDFKDGVTRRDRIGAEFSINSKAIEHSIVLATAERVRNPGGDQDLIISVINESGAEIHSEPVYPTSN